MSTTTGTGFAGRWRESLSALRAAQKPAARSAPAYSRYVNRRLGRVLAAGAHAAGLTPNQVTAVSAAFTFAGVLLLLVAPTGVWLGIVVAVLFVVGYAFDSADGQVSRLTGTSSPAGEWLDHMVDALKTSAIPLAVGAWAWRTDRIGHGWVPVPLAFAAIAATLFFGMILTEQLRRAHGVSSAARDEPGRPSWLRAVLVLPMDYGVQCLVFVLIGAPIVFAVVYTLVAAATTLFLAAASVKWFRDIRALPATSR